MAVAPAAVQVEGLNETRRDLRLIDQQLPRELGQAMKAAAQPVLETARSNTPVRTGRLQQSLRLSAAGTRVSIVSRVPYANVIEWGGTTGRGHRPGGGGGSVRIKGRHMATRAAEQKHDEFVNALARSLDEFFARHGWA